MLSYFGPWFSAMDEVRCVGTVRRSDLVFPLVLFMHLRWLFLVFEAINPVSEMSVVFAFVSSYRS